MSRIKATKHALGIAGRASGRFIKIHGECLVYAAICVLLLGWAQTQDEHSNWRFAKEATGSYYAGK